MKAIIETGGKQYGVDENTEIYVEKINKEPGETVTFDKVLYVNGKTGTPTVKGAKVTAEVVKQGKNKKIKVFHYNAKKKFRKTMGHRQPYTKLVIKKIEG